MYPMILKAHDRPINVIRLNYDGDLMFTGSADNKINVWETYTGERLGSYQTKSSVKSLIIDENSEYLTYVSFGGTLQMFEVKTGKQVAAVEYEDKLKQIEISLGSKKVLVMKDEMKLKRPSSVIIYSYPDLVKLLLKARQNKRDQKLKYQEINSAKLSQFETSSQKNSQQDQNLYRITSKMDWYVDVKTLFASTHSGQIIRYDEQGSIINKAVIHPDNVINSFAFSKDYSILVTAANNGCKVVDPESLEVLQNFKMDRPVNTVSISPLFCSQTNPKYHFIIGGGTPPERTALQNQRAGYQAMICNAMYGTQVGKIAGHFGPINSIQFFRDGRGYMSGGHDSFIRVVRFDESYFDNPKFQ